VTLNHNGKLLHVEDLFKAYGDKLVLDDIDLSVRKGELCTVVGPSGCGKSTLLRLILGQERPTKGHVLIDGHQIGYPSPDRGIVYQRYSLYPHLTVLGNVLQYRNMTHGFIERRRRKAEFTEEAMRYLERVNLHAHAGKFPYELSGGMRQRVAIAQALIAKPRILLMDEPFGALDPQTREDMQLFLLELWESESMTIFFVTHDLDEALFLGSRMIVISQYYSDDREVGSSRGAKIVGDFHVGREIWPTESKDTKEFRDKVEEIRRIGFDKTYLQHIDNFNLAHKDSFRTLNSG
jgi:NitT/TauT family transport system ATP-binding protein